MKLIIQIPCYNEEAVLADTLKQLPTVIDGVDEIIHMIIDDGSTDKTVEVAKANGAMVAQMSGHHGLARGFMFGLENALKLGADIIVNTDADNQYKAECIPDLIQPILEGNADIVVGARPISNIKTFSPIKKLMQKLGSAVVRVFSGTVVDDAPSGFRAMTADAALRLNVFNRFSYTIETLIQAGQANLRVVNVPIEVNAPTRPSKLMKSIWHYITRNIFIILSTYVIYHPAKVFGYLALFLYFIAGLLALRFGINQIMGWGSGNVQSVVASAGLAIMATVSVGIGIIAHLQAINRRLLEEVRYHTKRNELSNYLRDHKNDGPEGSA